MSDEPLLHIAPASAWRTAAAGEHYRDPSLDAEGFIHCSTAAQLLIPANERFVGRTDLVVLVIDPSLVDDPIVFEDCYESGVKFPHVYGPLPVGAITAVIDFPPNDDGTFELPAALVAAVEGHVNSDPTHR